MSVIESQRLRAGTQLRYGQYRIERYLDSGGFGITYLAYDTSLQQPVVIKEFFMQTLAVRSGDGLGVTTTTPANGVEFGRHRQKFRKEAQRIHNLKHDNIVRVDALFDENGTTYYAMEYVPGGSLADRMVKEGGRLGEAFVRGVLDKLLDALSYVHGKHLWHLDIKPANVLLTLKGEPVLIDFGASKYVTDEQKMELSAVGGIPYTKGFAPSEQMQGIVDDFGPWTDFYALGATLYKLLTGVTSPLPYALANNPALLSFEGADVSAEMQRLIRRLMAHNHLERPKSAEEVRALLGQEPPEPDDDTDNTITTTEEVDAPRPKPKTKWLVPAIAGLCAVVIIAIVAAVVHNKKSNNPINEGGGQKPAEGSDSAAVDIYSASSCPDNNHPHAIDLGLPSGTKWACCNVGASAPEENGGYYAWGETETKSDYSESNYMLGYVGSDIAGTQYDVAHVKWGNGWRMPTKAQQEELKMECESEWTTENGVSGHRFTASNGASVFLPAAGRYDGASLFGTGSNGNYWSGALGEDNPSSAYSLDFYSGGVGVNGYYRNFGFTVRPVQP